MMKAMTKRAHAAPTRSPATRKDRSLRGSSSSHKAPIASLASSPAAGPLRVPNEGGVSDATRRGAFAAWGGGGRCAGVGRTGRSAGVGRTGRSATRDCPTSAALEVRAATSSSALKASVPVGPMSPAGVGAGPDAVPRPGTRGPVALGLAPWLTPGGALTRPARSGREDEDVAVPGRPGGALVPRASSISAGLNMTVDTACEAAGGSALTRANAAVCRGGPALSVVAASSSAGKSFARSGIRRIGVHTTSSWEARSSGRTRPSRIHRSMVKRSPQRHALGASGLRISRLAG